MTETSTHPAAAAERLIPEVALRASIIDRDWGQPHSDAEKLDIAELRLLLGLPADTDRVNGDLMLRIVRRLVRVERALTAAGINPDEIEAS